ncbi:hypothetical protein K2173_015148 [Erythroxylum novogranatense]|uniref:Gnk2-homologous domain-containing protein n=1 Tax=Erythroxylum novogranatense TaxID=1862640 RepID=A0AAV8T137_9ROSI|nr:hypothetical protein K2173_015148 [Erythroxylum novogranatense]
MRVTISTLNSSRFIFFLFSVLIQVIDLSTSQQPNLPVLHYCLDKGNFTSNSSYESNLYRLLDSLSSNPDISSYGFSSSSHGQDANTVNAIAMCRGDKNASACRTCINQSSQVLPQLCPNRKEAILWYDDCMLRYSNRTLSGKMEIDPLGGFVNVENVSESEETQFRQAISTLLDDLESRAASGDSHRKFATGNVTLSSVTRTHLYVLVHCTPDLASNLCLDCLIMAYDAYNAGLKQGERVFAPSCQLRYELYPFFDDQKSDEAKLLQPPIAPQATVIGPSFSTSGTAGESILAAKTAIFGVLLSLLLLFKNFKKRP